MAGSKWYSAKSDLFIPALCTLGHVRERAEPFPALLYGLNLDQHADDVLFLKGIRFTEIAFPTGYIKSKWPEANSKASDHGNLVVHQGPQGLIAGQ